MSQIRTDRLDLSDAKRALLSAWLRERGIPNGPAPGLTIPRRTGDGPISLSFAQERLWFLAQLDPKDTSYNLTAAVRLRGDLQVAALETSISEIIRRHEILRTTFTAAAGEARQIIAPPQPIVLPLSNLQHLTRPVQETEIRRGAAEEIRRPFDLQGGPLLRTRLSRLAADEHVLLIGMHHIVTDGWSQGVFVRELAALYSASCSGRVAPLPTLPIQYADFALWQRQWLQGRVLDEQLAYWRRQLADLPALQLPTDRPPPAVSHFGGGAHAFRLPTSLCDSLKVLSRREGVTLFMTLLAAFKVLLARSSGQDDIVVGTPVANRNRAELEGLIGFFVNTLVFRTDLSENPTFREVLKRVGETALGAFAHQDIPFEKLVAELRPERNLSRNPLFQVLFVFQNAPQDTLRFSGLELSSLDAEIQSTPFDLVLGVMEDAEGMTASLDFRTELFEPITIARMAERYRHLLESIAANPEQRIGALPFLTASERHTLLVDWNHTPAAAPPTGSIHELFAEQAARTPDALAVVGESGQLTYQELDRRANQLARRLRQAGVGPDMRVGVCLGRSPELAVALLAVLRAGGAYVPLDPAYPPERLALLLDDAQAAHLITEPRLRERLSGYAGHTLFINADGASLSRAEEQPPDAKVSARNIAYVIYTSGSTGRPKGVLVEHGNLVASTWARLQYYGESAERFLLLSSCAFDSSVAGIFGTLCQGGCLILPPEGTERDPRQVGEWIAKQHITHTLCVPSLYAFLLTEVQPQQLASLRRVIVAGEACPPDLVRRHFELLPDTDLFNEYGPTEATVWSSVADCRDAVALPAIPIGRPIVGARVYVLDRFLNPVPAGVPGELYIGGLGIARGYLHRSDITAERFLPDPFSQASGARLYGTGDRARWRHDGSLEFLGRVDQQVKLRGVRIEPGETEEVLRDYPGVRAAVVSARDDSPGDKRLVAYVVPHTGTVLSAAELRGFMSRKLPPQLVPAAVVFLDALPLTPNGKLDRSALPPPGKLGFEGWAVSTPPRNPVEALLATIWCELLGIESVGVHDNFFDLGGHSLLATQVMSRVRQLLQADLPLRVLFEHPTIAGLAQSVQAARQAGAGPTPPLRPAPRSGSLPLSFAQQRLWLFEQMQPGSSVYNQAGAVRLVGDLDVSALERSLATIVQRHEVLRTRFVVVGGEPAQVVAPFEMPPLPLIDLSDLPPTDRGIEVERLMAAEAERGFDLERGPLLRSVLLRLGEREHVLLLSRHHIVADGWSMGVYVREFAALYAAFRRGEPSPLPPLSLQYADFAIWQRQWLQGDVLERQLIYWEERLRGAPVLALPTDRPRPAVQQFRGTSRTFELPPELSEALRRLSRSEGVTLFMLLLAAFKVLLARYSGQDDIVVGTPIANRNRAELEGLIGFFVNTLVLRTDLSGNPTFRELIGRVREAALGAYDHQELPFEKLVERLQPPRDPSRHPLFQVMFVLQNAPRASAALPGLRLEGVPSDGGMALFDLILTVDESDADLLITLEYDKDLFEEATIHRIAGHYRRLLESIVADANQRVSCLPLLGEMERRQMLAAGCGPVRAFPLDSCLHQQFEAQAQRTPDAIAVEHGEQRLTYRELNEQANRVAHLLRQAAVGRGDFVVILQERGPDFLTAMLATFKAGAAYVPIDANYPRDRVQYLLDRCEARTLLSHYGVVGRFNDLLVGCTGLRTLVCFDDAPQNFAAAVRNGDLAVYDRSSLARFAATDPCNATEPSDPLYMIFTSGSTGPPKGVVIRHDAALNHIYAQFDALRLESGFAFLQSAPSCSDISVWQFLAPVLSGGRVVVAGEEVLLAPPKLFATLRDGRLTIAELVPAILQMLTEHAASLPEQERRLPNLRWMMVTGEAVPVETVNAWLRAYPANPVVNAYGPTEAADDVLQAVIDRPLPEGSRSVPIGRPLANLRIYIVDGHLQLVPTGVVGEICVGGVGVGVGYWKDEERTQASFVADPFVDQQGARMYRTGDLGRWLPDGTVEFLGRRDGQVKVYGFRVELGEIEAVLRQHPAVKEAAVVVTEASGEVCSSPTTDGERELAAYVVAAAAGSAAAADLRDFLRTKLPAHMVPAAFVFLERLPLTPSGKVDRRALPGVDVTALVRSEGHQAPRTHFEQALTEIWQSILGIERIGIDDNFFELGGHSLLAAQMLFRAHNLCGRNLPLSVLFQKPTIHEMAKALAWAPASRASFVVPLRPQGSKEPFFCIHPLGGTALCYFSLARYLDADQPFYAIRAPELGGERQPFESIEDMASCYIDAVRRVQPEAPYLLGGWSMGGAIAFEMARELHAKGARVGLVALLDTEPPTSAAPPLPYPLPLGGGEGRVRGQDDITLLADIASDLNIPVSRKKLVRLAPEEWLDYVVQQAVASEGDAEVVRNTVNRYFTTCKAHERALAAYRPSVYAGSVTLFRCRSKSGKEYMHGWGNLAAGGVQIHAVPGSHQTMITEPRVRILARKLQASIDAVLAES